MKLYLKKKVNFKFGNNKKNYKQKICKNKDKLKSIIIKVNN